MRADTNQPEIVKWFRAHGAQVSSTTKMGGGFPDLLVTYKGFHAMVEVKRLGETLRPNQERWHKTRQGLTFVVHDIDEAQLVLIAIDDIVKEVMR